MSSSITNVLSAPASKVNSLIQKAESFVIRNAVYPLWTRRDHPTYPRYRRLFEKSQFSSEALLEHHQFGLLREQLLHAYRHVPYYKMRFDEMGITPLEIRSLDDLRRLPILTKRDIQDNKQQLLAENIPAEMRSRNQTGGSTGSPLQFWVDKQRFDARRASTDRHNGWAGLRPGDFVAQIWGALLDLDSVVQPEVTWRQRLLHRQLLLNSSRVGEQDMYDYIKLLRKYRPQVLVAYAQSAVMFAEFCLKNGIRDIEFKSIITTAEVLHQQQRAPIEQAFGGKVFNRYGCREVSVIASECDQHTGMHVNADALIVEIEPVRGLPKGQGRVLVTDLLNRSMPLIRYEIGDLATWVDGPPCPCGRALPRIASIEGRTTDFLVLPDGSRIAGPSLALLHADMQEVRQIQYVQHSRSSVTLNIVPGINYGSETSGELKRRLVPYLKNSVELEIHLVPQIAKEASGKYRFVKTDMDEVRAGEALAQIS